MRYQREERETAVDHQNFAHQAMDALNLTAVATLSFSGMLDMLWQYLPGPTTVYMVVSAAFMLFQMSDKLGLLERFKRTPAMISPPHEPPEGH